MQEFSKEEHKMEDNKECEETEEGTGNVGEENKKTPKNNNMEEKEQEIPSDESEYNYSEDFEVQFRIPGLQNVNYYFFHVLKDDDEVHCSKKTPEILIKIQEKDKRRREKREQIRYKKKILNIKISLHYFYNKESAKSIDCLVIYSIDLLIDRLSI